ncbi:MAG: FtsW/RodA/SpoVE family cell cycle protein, partial [Chloroflexota bacterium]
MMTSILKRWRYADYLLLLTLLALLAYGLLLVYSSTFPSTDTTEIALSSFVIRQGMFVAFGLLCMVIIASIDYRILHATAYLIYGVTILLLLVVLFGGHSQTEYGSQRWIDLKIFPLQPSELAKPALVMALARYYSDHEMDVTAFRHFLFSIVITAPALVLVYSQPDLGTSTTFVVIWFFMAVVAGVRFRY